MQNSDADKQKTVRCLLGSIDDHAATPAREFRLGDGDWPLRVFVVATDASVRVYRNQCPHLGWPLNARPDRFLSPDGELIVCSGHGAVFTKDSGECVGGPCLGQALVSYPVRVRDDGAIEAEIPRDDLPGEAADAGARQ